MSSDEQKVFQVCSRRVLQVLSCGSRTLLTPQPWQLTVTAACHGCSFNTQYRHHLINCVALIALSGIPRVTVYPWLARLLRYMAASGALSWLQLDEIFDSFIILCLKNTGRGFQDSELTVCLFFFFPIENQKVRILFRVREVSLGNSF